LSVSPQSGITSSNLTLTVTTDPHLAPGDYSATITITLADPALLPVTVPLTFRVAGSFVSFQNNPPFLYFEAEKTDPIPPPVQLQVTATAAGTPFTVQALTYLNQTPQWLLVSPTQGITPATLNVTVDPSQPITGTVELYVVGPFNSVSEPVGITINSPPGYIYPNPLTFWAKAGGASPPSQTAYATGIEQQDMKLTVATDEGGKKGRVHRKPT
jgi:hypothetical protein